MSPRNSGARCRFQLLPVTRQRMDVAVRAQDGGADPMPCKPIAADVGQRDGIGLKSVEHACLAEDGEALAERLVHQAAVGEARLGKDRADRRRRIETTARPELWLREVEHFY